MDSPTTSTASATSVTGRTTRSTAPSQLAPPPPAARPDPPTAERPTGSQLSKAGSVTSPGDAAQQAAADKRKVSWEYKGST